MSKYKESMQTLIKNDLDNIYNQISKFNISRWKLMKFYPIRYAKDNENEFSITDDEFSLAISNLKNKNLGTSIFIEPNNINDYMTSYFVIYPDGSVEDFNERIIGNLLDDDIQNILLEKSKELINNNLKQRDN